MLLVVDVGNTHITLGVFDGKELKNEVCVNCANGQKCEKENNGRCF